jgi:serine/threonine protein kinase/tetratricopeptide (TPR) repeat protein
LSLRTGDEIGTWLIEGLLGEGSMGVVYRCRDLEYRSIPAAVKVSKSRLSPRAKKRFIREAELLEQLSHEAIIQIRNKGEDPQRGLSWFAMELLEGVTFRERIQYPTPLSVGTTLSLFARISDGLAYAHERNIFHRDLKPSNLFLCLDGSVRILDFGVGLAVEWSPLTATDQQMGTYAYMPPEVFRGQTVAPALGDIYGLGLVLYEVLLGREVFLQPLTQMTTMKMNAEPMDLGSGFPEELRELLLSATDPQPDSRLDSMQEFADRVLELSLEYPPESDDQVFTEELRADILSRSAHSASAQSTLIPGGGGTGTANPETLGTGVRPLTTSRIAAVIPSAPADSWLLDGIDAPLSRSRILEMISAEEVSGSTRVARPGGTWRELRYHPNFRAYFTGKSTEPPTVASNPTMDSATTIELPRPTPQRRRWPIAIPILSVLLVGGYVLVQQPDPPEQTPVDPAVTAATERQSAIIAMLAARWPAPSGDAAALATEARALLNRYTRADARLALEKLGVATLLAPERIELYAGLAEAAARLEDTDDLQALADLSLQHARHLDDTAPSVARATLVVEYLHDNRSAAIGAASLCSEVPDCDLLAAVARPDHETLDAIIAANPDRPGMGLLRLEVLLEEQRWEDILRLAPSLQAALPDEPLPYRATAIAAAAMGDHDDAQTAATRAMALEPGWLDMAHLLGRMAHHVSDDPANALALLSAITGSPGFSRYSDQAGVWRDVSAAALDTDDLDRALEAADAASAITPADPVCRLQHAWAQHQKGDRTRFMSEISTISLSSFSGAPRARLGLAFARILATAGLNRQALLELRGALEADPGFTPAWLALAGVQASLGDSRQAAIALETAALQDHALLSTIDPLDPLWSPPVDLTPQPEQFKVLIARDITLTAREDALMGILYWLRDDASTARPLLNTAIRNGSQSPAVHAAMGQLLLAQQRYSEALPPLTTALQLSPGQPVLTAMHSYVLAVLGRRREASVQLAGLSDRLDDPPFVLWKARALAAAGEQEAARSLLTRYLRGQQRDPLARSLLHTL